MLCSRAKFFIDPDSNLDFADDNTTDGGTGNIDLEAWAEAFKVVNANIRDSMFFL